MKKILAAVLCATVFATTAVSQGNEFKVRYVGGSLPSSVKPDDWGNTITVSPELIVVKLKDGQTVNIDPKTVKLMTHSRHASRKIGTYAALAIVSPLFLLGMLKKNKRHFIGIATEDAEGKKNGYNFQAKNEQYRAVITALEGVTGMKVEEEVDEKQQKKTN
jgi:opacity protein-like surface antigen